VTYIGRYINYYAHIKADDCCCIEIGSKQLYILQQIDRFKNKLQIITRKTRKIFKRVSTNLLILPIIFGSWYLLPKVMIKINQQNELYSFKIRRVFIFYFSSFIIGLKS